MNSYCDEIQERIAADGAVVLKEGEHKHIESCVECRLFSEALAEVDSAILDMQIDPSEELVSSLLDKVNAQPQVSRPWFLESFRKTTSRLLFPLCLVVVASILFFLFKFAANSVGRVFTFLEGSFGALLMVSAMLAAVYASARRRFAYAGSLLTVSLCIFISRSMVSTFFNDQNIGPSDFLNKTTVNAPFPIMEERVYPSQQQVAAPSKPAQMESEKAYREQDASNFAMNDQNGDYNDTRSLESNSPAFNERTRQEAQKERKAGEVLKNEKGHAYLGVQRSDDLDGLLGDKKSKVAKQKSANDIVASFEERSEALGEGEEDLHVGKDFQKSYTYQDGSTSAVLHKRLESTSDSDLSPETAAVGDEIAVSSKLRGNRDKQDQVSRRIAGGGAGFGGVISDSEQILSPADEFFRIRNTTQGLSFKNAYGYWANTYIPGDSEARELEMHLSSFNSESIQFGSVISDGLNPSLQPFDAPQTSAMAVYINSDRSAIEGESRVLVQVGIKGTSRASGRRPAMNIGLVLDLRGDVSAETQARMRAVIDQFLKSKEIGDNYSITIAGRDGGMIVKREDFRHGPITLKLKDTLGRSAIDQGLSLTSALETSLSDLSLSDDPNSPLGSSAAIVITPNSLSSELPALTSLAHRSAVTGIPVSVFAVGEGAAPSDLAQLALAGQGSRRLISSQDEATETVRKELAAVSRTVARAVRLRIKLAPGVKLISIPGSYELSGTSADKVREAEQAIDRRLARNLGIESDRGEDEDGVQIVIPAFYADDNHVITLDLLASGPGPVAEVSLKYKDLVFLKNGSAQSHLTLARGQANAGALNLNVTKNFLSYGLSSALTQAGEALGMGNVAFAITTLREQLSLLSDLRVRIDGLDRDADILSRIEMLQSYIYILERVAAQGAGYSSYIASSLRLAGIQSFHPETTTSSIEGE